MCKKNIHRQLFTADNKHILSVSWLLIERVGLLPLGFIMLEDFHTQNIYEKHIKNHKTYLDKYFFHYCCFNI